VQLHHNSTARLHRIDNAFTFLFLNLKTKKIIIKLLPLHLALFSLSPRSWSGFYDTFNLTYSLCIQSLDASSPLWFIYSQIVIILNQNVTILCCYRYLSLRHVSTLALGHLQVTRYILLYIIYIKRYIIIYILWPDHKVYNIIYLVTWRWPSARAETCGQLKQR
jgi:hypothetical protein